jgi:ankyrin repeat protein
MSRPSTARMFATHVEYEHKQNDEEIYNQKGNNTDRSSSYKRDNIVTSYSTTRRPQTARTPASTSLFLARFSDIPTVTKPSRTMVFLKAAQEDNSEKLLEILRTYRNSQVSLASNSHSHVDFNVVDEYDMSPFLYACKHGDYDVVDELLYIPNLKFGQKDKTGQNALMLACFHGHYTIVEAILERMKSITPINTANSRDYIISINGRTIFGITALMKAIICATPISESIVQKLCGYSKVMLDIKNTAGETAMQIAFGMKHIAKMKILFEHGANLETVFFTCLRNSPLENIVMFEEILAFSGILSEMNKTTNVLSKLTEDDHQILKNPEIHVIVERANSRFVPKK